MADSQNGGTPLLYAAFFGHHETARVLLDANAQVDAAATVRQHFLTQRRLQAETEPAWETLLP